MQSSYEQDVEIDEDGSLDDGSFDEETIDDELVDEEELADDEENINELRIVVRTADGNEKVIVIKYTE